MFIVLRIPFTHRFYIIELSALIAFQNMSSKFNSALGVPPQGPFKPEAYRY